MNDTQKLIGKTLPEGVDRDAIHIAVLPVTLSGDAHNRYYEPGCPVRFVQGSRTHVERALDPVYPDKARIGILDPFLTDAQLPGTRVFVFLYPNTVTSLKHAWTHPLVDTTEAQKAASEAWLQGFAGRWRMNYDDLLEAATDRTAGQWSNYVTAMDRDLHSFEELEEDGPLFWEHLEKFTGERFDDAHRGKVGWSCSC